MESRNERGIATVMLGRTLANEDMAVPLLSTFRDSLGAPRFHPDHPVEYVQGKDLPGA